MAPSQIKVSLQYRTPDETVDVAFDQDTLIQTIETFLDEMGETVWDEDENAWRELLIRVERTEG